MLGGGWGQEGEVWDRSLQPPPAPGELCTTLMVYLVDQPSTVLDRVKNSMGVASRTTATAGHLLKHTTHPKNTRTTWPPCSVQIRIEACLSAEFCPPRSAQPCRGTRQHDISFHFISFDTSHSDESDAVACHSPRFWEIRSLFTGGRVGGSLYKDDRAQLKETAQGHGTGRTGLQQNLLSCGTTVLHTPFCPTLQRHAPTRQCPKAGERM